MRGTKNAVAIAGAASAALGLVVLVPLPAQAATINVAAGSGCSDTPTSGSTTPYCTINAAVRAAASGDTISVGAGTYREQVEVTKDVTIVTASGATVTGADSGGTPVRTYGFRLTSAANGAAVRGFTVVDVRSVGVRADAVSGAVLDDLDVSGSGTHGIELVGGSGNTVQNVDSHDNTSIGVRLMNEQNSKVLSSQTHDNHNHGVSLQGGSGNRVAMVRSFENVNMPGAPRTATGIDVSSSSTSATIEQNTTFGNGDSGIQIYPSSPNALVRRNVSYDNGDHGIDVAGSPGVRIISNTVVGHPTAGINVEASGAGVASVNATIRNNISVNNGITGTATRGDIRVDAVSLNGATLDRDLVWNTDGTAPIIRWGNTSYSSLTAFRSATGQETNGISADPRLGGSFALTSGSPALDAADARVSGWLASDRDGKQPFDQASVPNTGAGTPPYADLGALELTSGTQQPPPTTTDSPPTAKLTANRTSVAAGGQVTLDASGSSDDKGITSYSFDCGNGTAVKTGTAKTSSCTYASAGSFTAKVTVKDTAGTTASATVPVTVTSGDRAPNARLTVNDATVRQLVPVRLDASGSTAGSAAIDGYTFNCGRGGADRTSATATMNCRYRARGHYTATVTVTDADARTSQESVEITVRRGGNPSARLGLSDRHVKRGQRIIADASHSFGDRWWPVKKARISCAGHSRTARTTDLAMRCSFRHVGVHRIRLTVWNNLGHRDTAVRRIWVRRG